MAIAITEDHRELHRVVLAFLDAHRARGAARAALDGSAPARPDFWTELAELGWLGLHLAEEHGGSGFGMLELAVVVEGLGHEVTPGPFLPTVAASAVLSRCGGAEQRARLLPSLADGTRLAAVGLGGNLRLESDGTLSGDASVVLGAAAADLLLLRAGDDIVVLDRAAEGVELDAADSLDPSQPAAGVRLTGVRAEVLPGASEHALAIVRTLAAAQAAGGAHACLEMAVAYAGVREQFGRPIGSFQAIKHHCADLLVRAELATAAAWDAARAIDTGGTQAVLAASVAATQALPAFQRNAQVNIQVHGGIGYTWEHDAHLYLRRAATLAAIADVPTAARDVARLNLAGVRREFVVDLPPEAETVRTQVRAFAERVRLLDPGQQRAQLVASGYGQPHWPRPWGRGAGAVEQLVIEQELDKIERPRYGSGSWIMLVLITHGTPEQVRRWVPPSLAGELTWGQLFSEPGAGSDAAGIRTRATKVDGGWLVTGQKVWISAALPANRGFATVRTDPVAAKHAGISTMVLDLTAPGVDIRPLRQITGNYWFNEIFLDEVFVPADDVVGQVNGGWALARSTLGRERVTLGAATTFGGAVDLLAVYRESDRDQHTDTEVGRLLAESHTLGLLNVRAAARAVAGVEPGPEGNVTKLARAEHTQRSAELALRLLGPAGALLSGPAADTVRGYLHSRMATIGGGTSEITRNQIAERILGLPRDPQ